MKKANQIIIPLLLAFVLLAAGSATPVSAAEAVGRTKGCPMMGNKKFNKEAMLKHHEEMKAKKAVIDKALADNNYSAWVAAVGADSELAKKITSDKFAKFVEAHNLRKQFEAKMAELGFGETEGGMMKMGWGGAWKK